LAAAVGANAQQQDPERGCRAHAALSTGASSENIFVQRTRGGGNRGNLNNGNYELTWEAWVADDKALTGRCESDVRGTIVTFQRISVHGGRRPNSNAGFNSSADSQGLGRLSADSQGHGNLTGLGMDGQVDRATVVLQDGKATTTLYSGGNRVSIYGSVTAQPQQNEFTVQIESTDRSRNASGTMQIRVNRDANAVNSINLDGRAGRQQFNGTFSRDNRGR